MLEHIDRLKNVGLFNDFVRPAGEIDFGGRSRRWRSPSLVRPMCSTAPHGLTIVFGENGAGKSTLAAVLDSLRENSPATITRRRSLPGNNLGCRRDSRPQLVRPISRTSRCAGIWRPRMVGFRYSHYSGA